MRTEPITGSASNLLDEARVNEIVKLMREAGDDAFEGLISGMRNDIDGFQALLGSATIDEVAVGRTAHGLKGACRSLGAAALGDLYAECERLAKTGETTEIQRRHADNQMLIADSLAALRAAAAAAVD